MVNYKRMPRRIFMPKKEVKLGHLKRQDATKFQNLPTNAPSLL
jgi:hypothetical protein